VGRLANKEAWDVRGGGIRRLLPVVKKLAEDYDAVHIRTQAVFSAAAEAVDPAHCIWDGVHPLPQGHELIARHWIQKVSARWRRTEPA